MKIKTSSIATSIAVLFTAFLTLVQPAHALLIEYTGDEVASVPWTITGTGFTIDAGAAHSITFGPTAVFADQAATDSGSQWNPDLVSGFVEMKFQIDVDGFGYDTGLSFSTGARQWTVLIDVGFMTVNSTNAFPAISALTMYTLRFNYDAVGLDVLLDGSPVVGLQDIAGAAPFGHSGIFLHRFVGTISADSQATYTDVSWDAVPEPGTMGLLSVGSLFALAAAGRRRRSGRA